MTTTQQFITHFDDHFDNKGRKLISDFFITFSRFECALKNSITYANARKGKVEANWDKFTKSIRARFNKSRTKQLNTAVSYIIDNPPKIQTINQNQITWIDRQFPVNEPDINKLGQHIRDIRNNLFHGGKFNGTFQCDVSRNYQLLKNSMVILDEWLTLNASVQDNFLSPIN